MKRYRETPFDVIIIGGGVNGAGIARDCALRGLSTVLLEKNDIAGGTTGACSGMIHGGPRYLLSDIATTRTSCIDSGHIQRIAHFMIFRIPFVFPVVRTGSPLDRVIFEGAASFFGLYDRFQRHKNGRPSLRLTPAEVGRIEPLIEADILGGVSFDEYGIDTFRLCVANCTDAAGHGAAVLNHTEARSLEIEAGTVCGVHARDCLTGERFLIPGRTVVNAAGPWAEGVAGQAGCKVRLRPAKGVHLIFGRRITNHAITSTCIDGRQIFLMPHENSTILGTTDDDFYGDPDRLEVTGDEIEYLLQGIERVVPSIRGHRVVRTMAGVRPTLFGDRKYEDLLSREHRLYDHAAEGAPGFITIAGGKLASYRLMAEETADLVCRKLSNPARCTTHLQPLPGAEPGPGAPALADRHGIDPYTVRRLWSRHGCRAAAILERPGATEPICGCEPVLEAELAHCIEHEWVRRLSDLRRRTRLGCGPCQGTRCIARAARLFAELRGLSLREMRDELDEFAAERWRGNIAALDYGQAAQEELKRNVLKSAFGEV